MKWNKRNAESALQGAASNLPPIILVYGDDAGAVRQYGQQFVAATGVPLDDPFSASKISFEDVLSRSSSLLEAATTMGFGGGLKLVKVEGVNGDISAAQLTVFTNALKECLAADLQDVVMVVAAPRVAATHALAKAVEKDSRAAGLRCFHDSAQDIGAVARNFMQTQGKQLSADALAFLQSSLGADRESSLREFEKLAVYVGERTEITLEDCLQVVADTPAVNVFKLCDAIGARDVAQTDRLLGLLAEEGEDMNMVFMLAVRHLRRLLQAKEAMISGMPQNAALKTLTPPVNFGADGFMRQVNGYPLGRLQKTAERAAEVQLQSRQGALPQDLVYARAILSFSA